MPDFREVCTGEVERYAPEERQEYRADLSLNENPLGCSDKVLEALRGFDKSDLSSYRPVDKALVEKISDYESVDPENVLVSAGSDKCLQTVAMALFKQGDEVAFPSPSFPRYRFYARLMGADFRDIEYPVFNGRDTERLTKKAEGAAHMILDNPGNPTGHRLSEKKIQNVSESFRGNLILDMALEIGGVNAERLIDDQTFLVRSFSKFLGIAGLRLGYIIASKDNIDRLKSIVSPFEVNSIAQVAGLKALEDQEHMERSKRYIEREMNHLKERLEDMNVRYTDSSTTSMVLEMDREVQKKLKERRINFVAGKDYKGLPEDTVRIGVRNRKENRVFVDALEEVVEG